MWQRAELYPTSFWPCWVPAWRALGFFYLNGSNLAICIEFGSQLLQGSKGSPTHLWDMPVESSVPSNCHKVAANQRMLCEGALRSTMSGA